jgi:hypothetical protein
MSVIPNQIRKYLERKSNNTTKATGISDRRNGPGGR